MSRHSILIILALILAFFNIAIFGKEDLKANGEQILLELAPVDPRSLMQGDYMRLRYQVVVDANERLKKRPKPAKSLSGKDETIKHVILKLDEQKRASFHRFDDGNALQADERLFEVRYKNVSLNPQVEIIPDSFFFQEGHAKLYETAAYGVMRLAPDGTHLLVGLADKQGKILLSQEKR